MLLRMIVLLPVLSHKSDYFWELIGWSAPGTVDWTDSACKPTHQSSRRETHSHFIFTSTFKSRILFLSAVGLVICCPSSRLLLSQQNRPMVKRLMVEHDEEKDAAVLHTLDDSSHSHCDLYLSCSPLFLPSPPLHFYYLHTSSILVAMLLPCSLPLLCCCKSKPLGKKNFFYHILFPSLSSPAPSCLIPLKRSIFAHDAIFS